jgi:23S rRNA G2445 N2-methylase RlmL
MEYILISLLIVIISILIYGLKNSLNKIELYEQFIRDRKNGYDELYNRMKEIDSRDLFESDDEVGVVFTELKNEIESFKNILD